MPDLPGATNVSSGRTQLSCQGDASRPNSVPRVCGLYWVRLRVPGRSAGNPENGGDLVAACPDDTLTRFEYEVGSGECLGLPSPRFFAATATEWIRKSSRRGALSHKRTRGLTRARRWIEHGNPTSSWSSAAAICGAARESRRLGDQGCVREMFIESFDCHIYPSSSVRTRRSRTPAELARRLSRRNRKRCWMRI